MTKLAVLCSGRGTDLQSIIDAIKSGDLNAEISVVLTDKPNVKALERAQKAGIKNICVDRKKFDNRADFEAELLKNLEGVDLVILAGFMRILSPEFVRHYEGRCGADNLADPFRRFLCGQLYPAAVRGWKRHQFQLHDGPLSPSLGQRTASGPHGGADFHRPVADSVFMPAGRQQGLKGPHRARQGKVFPHHGLPAAGLLPGAGLYQ